MRVIDSYTGGEPTRVVIDGGPDPRTGSLADRTTLLAEKFDTFHPTVILEPRGSEALAGALLCEPSDARTEIVQRQTPHIDAGGFSPARF